MSKPYCFFCQKVTPHTELRDVLIGGDEEPCEEVPACGPCITKRRERAEYEDYLRDPFNESYERARASGWSD